LLGPYNKLFGPWATRDWFQSRGLDLKTEPDGRVFPSSDRAASVIAVLEAEAAKYGCLRVQCGAKVTQVRRLAQDQRRFAVRWRRMGSQEGEEEEVECDRLICATGGGRAGFLLAETLGHTISPPRPSLFSLRCSDSDLTALAGLSAPHAQVRLVLPSGGDYPGLGPESGPVLVTKQGLSGPAVLRLSAFAALTLAALQYSCAVEVNWLGEEVSEEVLFAYFVQCKHSLPHR